MTRSSIQAVSLAVLLGACGEGVVKDGRPGVAPESSNLQWGGRVHTMPRTDAPRAASTRSTTTHLTYYGGPVLSNVRVYTVFWNASVNYQSQLPGFYQTIIQSPYFDWLSEYDTPTQSIGRGTFGGTIVDDAPPAGTTIDDSQIQQEVDRLITAGRLPANTDGNDLYMFYFPPGLTITQGGQSSCQAFCAYHGTLSRNGQYTYYGVVPDLGGACASGCGNSDQFSNTTSVSSHEMIEAVTDAAVGLATSNASPLAWYDSNNGEIGDICNAQQGQVSGYTVQKEWSNSLGSCILTNPNVPTSSSSSSSTSSSSTSSSSGTSTSTSTSSSSSTSGSTASSSGSTGTTSGTSSSGGSGGLLNDGFEAGYLSGWTPSGASSTVANSGCHSGTYCAQLGLSSPTSGDSSIAQTFTAPAGSSNVSFWYKVTCPDTVQYDWATATLADHTAGTTATVLAHTCTASGSWTQASAGLTAGHSYTLTLTSHDDDYSADPTFTLFDDVSIAVTSTTSSTSGSTSSSGSSGGTTGSTSSSSGGTTGSSGIANGDFETGNLSGWTGTGSAAAVTGVAYSGSYSAQLGAQTATNGDSSIVQTFTVPSGKTHLTFHYLVTCPDTVQYDWATATLRNNHTGASSTILAKTCTNDGSWASVTAAVTAGTAYTLTLTSHDDNYAGDPTYTNYDGVSLN